MNVTNGVTPRRFLALANPRLAAPRHRRDRRRLADGPRAAARASSRSRRTPRSAREWREVKRANKADLAGRGRRHATGVACDPDSLFDVQVKRIHEYKRQHLNVLHVIALWRRLRREPEAAVPPRTVALRRQGRARLPHGEAHDQARPLGRRGGERRSRASRGRLRVAFVPDYNVTNCMPIFPAAELSEQISTAGKEASGTGNMKFAMNGALTIGTLDGANVEIREAVGRGELLPVRPHGRRDPRAAGRRLPPARAATRTTPSCAP